ncbi:hypothetical protein CMI37_13085 [Candidatus Pacearchaeota archaeon]|nr:hypothetical protein [Candidatus Pacearchaeota archaeon]|tara:strand:+ start:3709 stop:4626 length:918 start_codon:yes stop_codon:yes gene_type:complete
MQYLRAYAKREDGEPTADGPVTFVASTEGVKEDGLDLQADAWDLSRYAKYSPVLWAHDYWGDKPPIGTGAASIEDSKLMIDVTFDADDPFAMTIRAKALKGMVAGSVGWGDVTQKEETKHQLREFSMVPVPLDPDALPVRQARGLRDLAQHYLDILEHNTPTFDEADWPEVSRHMVGILAESGGESEEWRKRTYNRLEKRYRQLGKVAPEFRTAAELEPLGPAEIRGLFLEDEVELHGDLFPERLRLRKAQIDAIHEHLAGIADIMDKAETVLEPEPPIDFSIQADASELLQGLTGALQLVKLGE